MYKFLKRIMDFIISLISIVMLMPFLFIIALLIKLDDKDNIFYSAERIGKDCKKIKMYKFRTMKENCEDIRNADGSTYNSEDDPRVTKIGKVLRKTSLDELPQLFNVLKGDMSLVGPRPPIPREVIQYNKYQYQRLLVKPGITCYWQISGRNNIDFDEWVELDLKYIKERNLFKDIYIILMTLPVLLGDKNAS